MDFASMKSVQMLEFAQQQFYSSFTEEISKRFNETISQLEREIEEKDRVIANLRKQLSQKQVSSTPKEKVYAFKYDVTDFKEGLGADDVEYFFAKLIELTEIMNADDCYIVDTGIAIVPIFKMITESAKFKGSNWEYKGDLTTFCKYWNINVVGNLKDETRKASLLCKYATINTELNRAPWKGYGPASWKMSSVAPRYKTAINRAINIKVRMEQLFL